jgi:hypothetical protein
MDKREREIYRTNFDVTPVRSYGREGDGTWQEIRAHGTDTVLYKTRIGECVDLTDMAKRITAHTGDTVYIVSCKSIATKMFVPVPKPWAIW